MTTSWTLSDVAALESAIKRGVRSVTYQGGNTVQYHSLDEMLRLLDRMRADVTAINDGNPATVIYAGRVT